MESSSEHSGGTRSIQTCTAHHFSGVSDPSRFRTWNENMMEAHLQDTKRPHGIDNSEGDERKDIPPVCELLSESILQPNGRDQPLSQAASIPSGRWEMATELSRTFITQDELAESVKGIYAALIVVEGKSIAIDTKLAAEQDRQLTQENWQELLKLRRTLLYCHHDFLMAALHPAANTALRALATKYCMPARLWKHGIHGFLELLRYRRPESLEYMLDFIYMAYGMLAILYETVSEFSDIWIECLGDLSRYRMAIEEDKNIHAAWGDVARRWYTMKADREPQSGRIYHHLGILERSSLRKLFFYCRSLTSTIPFNNARDSLDSLCASVLLHNEASPYCDKNRAERMTIYWHALVYSDKDAESIGWDTLELLKDQSASIIASYATPLAVANIASLFQYGMERNIFRQMFQQEVARSAHKARALTEFDISSDKSEAVRAFTESQVFVPSIPRAFVTKFMVGCFNDLIYRELDHATIRDLLEYVHVNLVFFSALFNLTGLTEIQYHMVNRILGAIDWECLAVFLNSLTDIDPISCRVENAAAKGEFLVPERVNERKPLSEDFMLRGLIWAEGYVDASLLQGLENDDGARGLETPARLHLRAERVEWLACCMFQRAKNAPILYDHRRKRFTVQHTWGEERWKLSQVLPESSAIDHGEQRAQHRTKTGKEFF